jgi:hypothetical protein
VGHDKDVWKEDLETATDNFLLANYNTIYGQMEGMARTHTRTRTHIHSAVHFEIDK